MPRMLFAIPHYFSTSPSWRWHGSESGKQAWRVKALRETVLALHQTFGNAQCVMQLCKRRTTAANLGLRGNVQVVILTAGDSHLLQHVNLPRTLYEHLRTDEPPKTLGYACHQILRDRLGTADWFGFMEEDLVIRDSWLFQKLDWFRQIAGDDAVLQANRYELSAGPTMHRAYVDGELRPEVTAAWQDVSQQAVLEGEFLGTQVRFVRTSNPHAGCFFLRAKQLEHWAAQEYFMDRSDGFIGPLESAATLGIMRAFRVYKPAIENAAFLEIQHLSQQFIQQLRRKSGSVG